MEKRSSVLGWESGRVGGEEGSSKLEKECSESKNLQRFEAREFLNTL